MTGYTLIFLFLYSSMSYAEKLDYPDYFDLVSETDNSFLKGTCSPLGNEKIKCDFTQFLLREEDIEEERQHLFKALLPENYGEFLREEKKRCRGVAKFIKDEMDYSNKLKSKSLRLAHQEPSRLIKERCSCLGKKEDKLKQCYEQVLSAEAESTTCTISNLDFSMEFTRAKKGKWIYNPGPQGACQVTRVVTLTRKKESIWEYNEIRADANTDEPLCKQVELNKPIRFIGGFFTFFKINCDFINFF